MINKIEKFAYLLILILPLSLIAGSAIPDISITLVGLYFLSLLFFKKRFLDIYTYKWLLISIFFWLFLIFISLFSENKYLAYRDAIIFIRILFIPIFIYFFVLNDENRIKQLALIVFLSVLFVCLDTIYQFTNYDPLSGFGKDIFGYIPESEFYGRLSGPFKDLVPGAYVSKFTLIGLVFIILHFKNKKLQKTLSIFYLTLAGFVTYISGERMALATFILGMSLLIIFFKNRRLTILISMILILISSFLANKIHPIYNDYSIIESTPYHLGLKIEKTYKCKDAQSNECKKIINLQPSFIKVLQDFGNSSYGQIYSLAIKMWKDHPLQGIGLNNFTYLCNNDQKYQNSIKNYNCVTHPHNFYLQWLVETGIFGLFLFLIYIYLIFNFVYNNIASPYAIIAFATLIILFWPIMSTGSLLKNWMGVSTFFIVGICLSLIRIKQKIL